MRLASWGTAIQAMGLATPRLVSLGQGNDRYGRSKRIALHNRILGLWPFAEQALSGSFCVAQSKWTPALHASFGLQEPPNPYEMAHFFSDKAQAMTLPARFACGRSALAWWCMGIGGEVIQQIVPDWEKRAAEYIKEWMTKPTFALWALSTDMRPVIRNRKEALAFATESPEFRKERTKIYRHPYIRGQLLSGCRLKPVPRRLPKHAPVWQTMEDREEWEEEHKDDWQMRKLRDVRKISWKIAQAPLGYTMPEDWEPQARAIL